ncbi:hypothetical protein MKK88_11805 [Methylobacterium sp. E-005]|nr:hypothetical protein [Methylobacterium sp. E-005]
MGFEGEHNGRAADWFREIPISLRKTPPIRMRCANTGSAGRSKCLIRDSFAGLSKDARAMDSPLVFDVQNAGQSMRTWVAARIRTS